MMFKKYAAVCADPDSIRRAELASEHRIRVFFHSWADVLEVEREAAGPLN